MIQDHEDGGMKAPDMSVMVKALKVKWIDRLQQDQNNSQWRQVIMRQLEQVGGLGYLLGSNYDVEKLPIAINNFWKEVFQADWELRV